MTTCPKCNCEKLAFWVIKCDTVFNPRTKKWQSGCGYQGQTKEKVNE